MKTEILITNTVNLILLLATVVVLISCDDDQSEDQISVDAQIKNTGIYEYRTGISGDEEGATITKQAQNYEISELVRDASTQFEIVYRYKPKEKFVGFEEVNIRTEQGSDGASPSDVFTTITLRITVAE
ncbi:MAG: hypothetical protein GY847_27010 [Proteobacteria bacterium]|nr:hypothetical protein [Pseudomonadota bacterium]